MRFGPNLTGYMKQTKASLTTYRLAAKIFLACVTLWIVITPNAYAYIDPGSGALIWQLLLAAFFGAMFFIRRVQFWIRATINWIWDTITGKR